MTNGERIQSIFPNITSRLDAEAGMIITKWADNTTKCFKASWWNAEYKEPRWILVSEKLPENDGSYFVTEKSGRICTYVFRKEGNSEEYWKRCAVAWMPLPEEPYVGVEV